MIHLPGLIDMHVHLRDPGQSEKEDFFTGTSAALAGGFTTIFDMPNNKIPITTKERLDEKIKIAKKQIVCNIGFYFGSLGDNLEEFKKVKDTVFALKLYLNETTGNFLISKEKLEDIFIAWKLTKRPILLHAEDDAIEAVLQVVTKTGQQVHFCHISLASDLKQIVKAKQKGLPVSCGVTPHHLFLTEHDAKKLGSYARMKPYLKSAKDGAFLWKNLKYIDVIESDHAPHTKAEKQSETPPFGVPGLETTLPLLLTAVSEKRLTIDDIIRLCHHGPMNILHIGLDPKTTVFIDETDEYTIENEHLLTKCKWTPFAGKRVKGKIKKVVLSGKTVFENGKIVIKRGGGKVLQSN